MKPKVTLLCILDGFGLNPDPRGNAVHMAKKPCFDSLMAELPHSTLITHGERVGLPHGQMGNSEVGHLNIGAGRVVEQWLLRISRALQGTYLDSSDTFKKFTEAAGSSQVLHLVGLYSDGGVHSHCEHLHLLVEQLQKRLSGEIHLHLITDGRDTSPQLFLKLLPQLESFLKQNPRCKIATVCGRFYAMDRDKRWERTNNAYLAMAEGRGEKPAGDLAAHVLESYKKEVTDEFLEPLVLLERGMQQKDSIVFWNFREDRMRQIVGGLCLPEFSHFPRNREPFQNARVLCFTEYDHTFKLPYLFPVLDIKHHLGEVVSKAGLLQLRAAETEKYPHVTYFFNGGIEEPYPGEERMLVPSPRDVKTYDQKPEMSAFEVTEKVTAAIRSGKFSLIVVNLANCDMVGHTGVIPAAVKAVETVDSSLAQMLQALKEVNGQALIIADHGNAEQMINYEDGSPMTSHTTFPVPVIIVGRDDVSALRGGGSLCDVAPTILKMMGIEQASEMTGAALF
ncbi:MAG: 2,3-bisphosphoglycerate-independent phosphoglycerate mutase [Proteobacteria bacterium]|nr:MAG: 2,3-bisphosphoglycerate-independent phosphoglycerate mutase [Pseudomonadota bacterium]